MLNEKKVRLMARTAIYEQDLGKRTLKTNKLFEKGSERMALLENFPAGLLTFVLIFAAVAVCTPDFIRNSFESAGPVLFIIVCAAACAVFIFLYSLYARYMKRKQYENEKGVFWKYSYNKEKLKRILDADEEDRENSGGIKA